MPLGDVPQPERSRPESKQPRGRETGGITRQRTGPRRIELPYNVAPQDERQGRLSWFDRLRRDACLGGIGFLSSLLVHAILLVILGLIVIQTPQSLDGDPLVAVWSTPKETTDRAEQPRRSISPPISIASIVIDRPKHDPQTPRDGVDQPSASLSISPVDVTQSLADRNPRLRNTNLGQLGGSPDAERAIKAALGWLARHQTSDGHWELHQGYPDAGRAYIKTDTGATALALLAFLGHGETHQTGEFQQVVSKGLRWLKGIQDSNSGDLHDQRQEEGRNGAFYAHSMATIALCEALAMSHDEELRIPAERAVRYLDVSQHPDLGGWKYRPLNLRVMSGDISVTAWALMALHSARIAGIDVSVESFERSAAFLDRVQESGGSRYKYEPNEPASRVTAARTAMGLLCRQWIGWPKTYPPMVEGVAFLAEERHHPQWSAGRRNVFEWYYITQVLHNIGGDPWKQWNSAVTGVLVQNQIKSGSAKTGQDVRGSWSPRPDGEGEEYSDKAGRLYLTAICVLILETPYRHRPVYSE